jgi:hypothetical protein
MALTSDQIRRNIRDLLDDIAHLERKLDNTDPDSLDAESIERILNAKYGLLSEQEELRDAIASRAAREAAEARLAYHADEDTLDLY